MMNRSGGQQRNAFSRWLRTGSLPREQAADRVELKFNPWHDTDDGRFTFAGSGRHFGAGAPTTERARSRPGGRAGLQEARVATRPKAKTVPRDTVGDRRGNAPVGSSRPKSNPVVEFVGGVGEGLYDVAEGTVAGVYSALTTHPATTVRNAGRGIAGLIDGAVAAEDTPARVQISRAVDAATNASARDLGRATGAVAGNVALATAPGAGMTKVATANRLRSARPQAVTFKPPQVQWVKENLNSKAAWKPYNDSATGSRPGLAPALRRTMPDGSTRPVKFDGIEGDTLIDRKWSVSGRSRAQSQILRQSAVLAEHRLIGTWEVPTVEQRTKAIKLLQKMNVKNIKVKVVKPW